MAIVIPDLFGAFQKGREYAIDRNWKDLTNYEAIEKARTENDLAALNLLERRVMFAPKMGMYMDNADMSARNNALGGAAFPGLMAKTQAQSELDTAKSIVDRRNIPQVMNAYEANVQTSAGTALTESAIKNAENDETMKVAEKIGNMNAKIRYAKTDLERQQAENALFNEAKLNEVFKERVKTLLEEARLNNSDIASAARQLGYSIDYMQRLSQLVGANIGFQDTAHQFQKTPKQREDESGGRVGDNGKPLLNQEVEDYYLTGLSGVDKFGERISPNQAIRIMAALQSPENYDILLKTKSPNEIATVMTTLGRIAGGGVVSGNSSNYQVVPVKTTITPANNANNANKTTPLVNNAENVSADTDPNFVDLFGRRIPTSEIGNYTIGQSQLGQALLGQGMTSDNGIPFYIGGVRAVSPKQWYIGDANTQAFPLTGEQWESMQQGGSVPVLLTLPNNKFQEVLINPDLARRAGIQNYQVLTVDKLYALQQALGQ